MDPDQIASMQPPVAVNRDRNPRRVGVEFEYGGLSLPDSAALVAKLFGGEVAEKTLSHYEVETPEFGKFEIKLDMHLMQKLSAEAAAQRRGAPGEETFETVSEKLLAPILSAWVPNEIVTPPIPIHRLEVTETLTAAMREGGAKGTRASPIYAFGLHLNPEMPDIPAERLRDYLAAFVARQDWLKRQCAVDMTRQLTSFAPLFPLPYARLLLAEDYRPDLAQLIEDYLAHNPTRNRALDMLPLFLHLDEARVRRAITDERVRPRPTFHYRLPNCDLDNPSWSPLDEWKHWLEVERLAEDQDRLRAEAAAYLQAHRTAAEMLFE